MSTNIRRIAWHHLRCQIPADWEVTCYSLEDRAGRLEFSTRNGLEATVSWEECSREPDKLTTMTSFLANNILGKEAARERGLSNSNVTTTAVGEFMVGYLSDDMPLQALGYSRASHKLIRWIFEGHSSKTHRENIVAPILRSFDFNSANDSIEYEIFGVHAVLPRQYKIEDMVALPANVLLAFEGEESRARVTFRRWGLASHIRGDKALADFYSEIVRTNNIQVIGSESMRCNDSIELIRINFSAPRQYHSDHFMARRWNNGVAYVWHDKASNRISSFEQIGPKNYPALPISTVPELI